MMATRLRMLCLLVLAVVACGTATDSGVFDPEELGPATLQIGAGEKIYQPLEDGTSIPIVMGLQGGHMVAMGMRVTGIVSGDPSDPSHPDNPRFTFRASLAETEEPLAIITLQRGLFDGPDGAAMIWGSWMIFNPAVETAAYFGKEIEIGLRVVDVLGTELETSVMVMAVAPGENDEAVPPPTASLLDLDIYPGEVIWRVDDDAKIAARQVGGPEQKVVPSLWADIKDPLLMETSLKRHIPGLTAVGTVDIDHSQWLPVVHQEEFIAGGDPRLIDPGDVQKNAPCDAVFERVDPLYQRTSAEQKVVVGSDLVTVLIHRKLAVLVGGRRPALHVDSVPSTARQAITGALLEELGSVTDRFGGCHVNVAAGFDAGVDWVVRRRTTRCHQEQRHTRDDEIGGFQESHPSGLEEKA